jgi:uncharacterized membrane protein
VNGAQLHLALNHLPVVTTLIAALMFGVALALAKDGIRQTALFLLVLAGVAAGAAYLTGEPAEEIVERVVGISKSVIHDHEEAAEFAIVVCGAMGVAAAAALAYERRRPLPRAANTMLLIASLSTAGILLRTAHLGGLPWW